MQGDQTQTPKVILQGFFGLVSPERDPQMPFFGEGWGRVEGRGKSDEGRPCGAIVSISLKNVN